MIDNEYCSMFLSTRSCLDAIESSQSFQYYYLITTIISNYFCEQNYL